MAKCARYWDMFNGGLAAYHRGEPAIPPGGVSSQEREAWLDGWSYGLASDYGDDD